MKKELRREFIYPITCNIMEDKEFFEAINMPHATKDARKHEQFMRWILGEDVEFPFFKNLPHVELPRDFSKK